MPNKSGPLKWLLVGAGDIAHKRVGPALVLAPDSVLAAICDRRLETAQALAGSLGVEQVYTDYEEALLGSGADAVYLATPVYLHVEQLVQALEAGKHVLVEKPLSLDAAQCEAAVQAAAASHLTTACAYYRRLYPAYRYTLSMLEAGEFGQVLQINLNYQSWFNPAPDDPKYWRVVREIGRRPALRHGHTYVRCADRPVRPAENGLCSVCPTPA